MMEVFGDCVAKISQNAASPDEGCPTANLDQASVLAIWLGVSAGPAAVRNIRFEISFAARLLLSTLDPGADSDQRFFHDTARALSFFPTARGDPDARERERDGPRRE
jgi:hypothetical protein